MRLSTLMPILVKVLLLIVFKIAIKWCISIGYDGFPDFFGKLIDCVMSRRAQSVCSKAYFEDSGFDTSDSSDEKKSRAKLNSINQYN